MKKLLGLLLLICTPAFAGTISLNSISADSNLGTFNTNFTTVSNVINGNIEGTADAGASVSNIKADSVAEINMYDDANPRVRDGELLNITYDTVSGGVLTQGAIVESGCAPATSGTLTSDISACVAYVNGYRVSKGATSETYTASRDTYVDLSQSGVYTLSAVANGATQPSVAANSVRIAKVVTDGTTISSVTSLYTTRIAGLVIPANYRVGYGISLDSSAPTTTMTVQPGSVEINNTIISKTTASTLATSTTGDWAGGASLRATSTYGYVGIDASGNIKLHTTAPAYDNYAVSSTAGKKRFATWSSTVYRILGWFYMDASGSGNLNDYELGNLKEGDVGNGVARYDHTTDTINDTAYGSDLTNTTVNFYSSGNPVLIEFNGSGTDFANDISFVLAINSITRDGSECIGWTTAGGGGFSRPAFLQKLNQGTYAIKAQAKVSAASDTVGTKEMMVTEQ